ncbi:MAG: hypothetical protein CMG13_01520, partial [Candidatus Marinimicrobia bacterium]|nr:hypothetical protein [Candidatus Neomarinimicrobiota bacterium]
TDGTVLTLPALEQDCSGEWGGDSVVDECGVCDGDGSTCQDTSYYNVDIDWTGTSQLIIFQNSITGLEVGDEIGIFDSNAVIDNTGATGELLVGPASEDGGASAVWSGDQLDPVAIGAVDLSQFGGPILPGYQDGSSVVIKVYRPSTGMEYNTDVTYSAGTGTFGDLFMAISEITLEGDDGLDNDDIWIADSYMLNQNYPNPFNPVTNISFDAVSSGKVSLVVYDVLGNRVKTLLNGFVTPGHYVMSWDGTDENGVSVSSGVYIYTLSNSGSYVSKRMLLVK